MSITAIMEIVAIVVTWIVFGYTRKKKIVAVVFETVAMSVILCVIRYGIEFIKVGQYIIFWAAIHGMVSFLYVMCFTSFRRQTKILMWIAVYTTILNLTAIGGRIGYFVGLSSASINSDMLRVGCYLFGIPIVILIRHFNFDTYMKVPISGVVFLSFGIVSTFAVSIVESMYGFPMEMEETRPISVLLLLVYCILLVWELIGIFALHTMCSEHMKLTELQIQKQRLQLEHEMVQMSEETLEKLRCIRHDLKNQYAYMDILLSQNRYDELKKYFSGQVDQIAALSFTDCGNKVMNIIFNIYNMKLKKDNIILEHQIVIPPIVPFSDDDMFSLVTNLLDNAHEECKRLLENGKRDVKIRLEVHPHSSYLLIRCENTTDRTSLTYKESGLATTKKDNDMHGYGTKIISKIAEKYNGQAKFYLEDQKFIAITMLDMMREDG